MDDLLKKIKETEKEAEEIISGAEDEARQIIDKARQNVHDSIQKEKEKILKEIHSKRDDMLSKARLEKEKTIKKNVDGFIKNAGNIEEKKQEARDYLVSKIKDMLKIDV